MPALSVSAIIPTHNRARFLPRAIDSILVNLDEGDELIVVDDGSADDTEAVVAAIAGPIRYLRIEHGGAGAARNAGLDAARGDLVAFLDSDDEWRPEKIALQRTLLENRPDILFCFGDFGVCLEDGTEMPGGLRHWLLPPRPLTTLAGVPLLYSTVAPLPAGREDFTVRIGSFYLEEMNNNCVAAFTLMARRETSRETLRFEVGFVTAEEWPAFGRLARVGTGALLDTELACQHGHAGPRLTNVPRHTLGDAWLRTLESVWGDDPGFLADHREAYDKAVSQAHVMRAQSYARHGRLRQAAVAIRMAGVATFAVASARLLFHALVGQPPD
jgi:glycosyltransferase involved in cell wall biosynthesis